MGRSSGSSPARPPLRLGSEHPGRSAGPGEGAHRVRRGVASGGRRTSKIRTTRASGSGLSAGGVWRAAYVCARRRRSPSIR
jgi:hypothetical protein